LEKKERVLKYENRFKILHQMPSGCAFRTASESSRLFNFLFTRNPIRDKKDFCGVIQGLGHLAEEE
jgi:hypothetical protein